MAVSVEKRLTLGATPLSKMKQKALRRYKKKLIYANLFDEMHIFKNTTFR